MPMLLQSPHFISDVHVFDIMLDNTIQNNGTQRTNEATVREYKSVGLNDSTSYHTHALVCMSCVCEEISYMLVFMEISFVGFVGARMRMPTT